MNARWRTRSRNVGIGGSFARVGWVRYQRACPWINIGSAADRLKAAGVRSAVSAIGEPERPGARSHEVGPGSGESNAKRGAAQLEGRRACWRARAKITERFGQALSCG